MNIPTSLRRRLESLESLESTSPVPAALAGPMSDEQWRQLCALEERLLTNPLPSDPRAADFLRFMPILRAARQREADRLAGKPFVVRFGIPVGFTASEPKPQLER